MNESNEKLTIQTEKKEVKMNMTATLVSLAKQLFL